MATNEKTKEAEEGAAPVPPKKSNLKWILVGVLVLFAVGGGGAFAWFKFMAPHKAEAKAGDTLPFGVISFTQDVAGNVGVVMMSQNSAGGWDPVGTGVFMLAAKGAKAPKPSECPLE